MFSKRAGDLLHRFDLGTHDTGAPLPEESPGRPPLHVGPETLKVLAVKIGPDCPQVVPEKLRQLDRLLLGEVLWPFQEAPSRVLEDGFIGGPSGGAA